MLGFYKLFSQAEERFKAYDLRIYVCFISKSGDERKTVPSHMKQDTILRTKMLEDIFLVSLEKTVKEQQ